MAAAKLLFLKDHKHRRPQRISSEHGASPGRRIMLSRDCLEPLEAWAYAVEARMSFELRTVPHTKLEGSII